MQISVVIPAGRATGSLERTLRSLVEQDFPGPWELIVVANPPNLAIKGLAAALATARVPEIRVLESAVRGVNRAKNIAIEAARGDVVYFLDDDCLLERRDHIARVVRRHAEWPGAAAIGGLYRSPARAPGPCRFYNTLVDVWLCRSRLGDGRQRDLAGGNVAYKRRVFDAALRFDERIVYGGDETEFHHRLIAAGETLLLCGDPVIHDFAGDWRSIFTRAWKHGRGRARDEHYAALRSERRTAIDDPALRRAALAWAPLLTLYRVIVELGARCGQGARSSKRVPQPAAIAARPIREETCRASHETLSG